MSGLHHGAHHAAHHAEGHFSGSQILRDAVLGMSDGLTVPFALTAGLTGAALGNSVILTAGAAEVVAGAISMGLGGYLAARTEVEHYKGELAREYLEVERIPDEEKNEVRTIFANYGLSRESQDRIVDELARDTDKWVAFMMEFELGLQKPRARQAARSAVTISVAYALGGLIPLAGYLFTNEASRGLLYSSGMTLVTLGIFGAAKARLLGQASAAASAFKMMGVGSIAAGVAFFVSQLIAA